MTDLGLSEEAKERPRELSSVRRCTEMAWEQEMLIPVVQEQLDAVELVDEEELAQLLEAKAEHWRQQQARGTRTEPKNIENIHARCVSVSGLSWHERHKQLFTC